LSWARQISRSWMWSIRLVRSAGFPPWRARRSQRPAPGRVARRRPSGSVDPLPEAVHGRRVLGGLTHRCEEVQPQTRRVARACRVGRARRACHTATRTCACGRRGCSSLPRGLIILPMGAGSRLGDVAFLQSPICIRPTKDRPSRSRLPPHPVPGLARTTPIRSP